MARSTVRLTHNRLPEISRELGPAAEKALEEGADAVAKEAQSRVPVRTGALRDAITTEKDPQGWKVVAGDDNAFYGHMVEFGTTRAGARPFLVPALEGKKQAIENAVSAALERVK